MANSHRMGGKMDLKWLGPYHVEEITEKELYRLKCIKSGKLLKQAFSSLQLKAYVDRSTSKVMSFRNVKELHLKLLSVFHFILLTG